MVDIGIRQSGRRLAVIGLLISSIFTVLLLVLIMSCHLFCFRSAAAARNITMRIAFTHVLCRVRHTGRPFG